MCVPEKGDVRGELHQCTRPLTVSWTGDVYLGLDFLQITHLFTFLPGASVSESTPPSLEDVSEESLAV